MRRCLRTVNSLVRTWQPKCQTADKFPRLYDSIGFRFLHATSRLHAAPVLKVKSELEKRISDIPIERFRNFCIVAHVDHGKSTLSDRLLELTGTIEPGGNKQILDKLEVERERGITVKAQTCSMLYNYKGEDYLLNLVDTPGHVDFRAEVSRSYASCGGGMSYYSFSSDKHQANILSFALDRCQPRCTGSDRGQFLPGVLARPHPRPCHQQNRPAFG